MYQKHLTLKLQGDHYDMGQQHGHQVRELRPSIQEAIAARFRQIEQDGPDARFESLFQETREIVRRFAPSLWALIRGQAEALELPFETLLRYDLVSYLRDDLVTRKPPPAEECTTWAASAPATADGAPILVKNRDFRLEHLSLQVVIQAAPDTGYRYVCSGSAGSPGVFSAGINQAGLAVADTHVCSKNLGPGLPDYALMMHLLEAHDSVAAAVDYLRDVPRLGRNNLVLADAQGHLAVFESGHHSYGLLSPVDGYVVNTNHFVSAPLRDFFVDTNPPETRGNSFQRYEKVAQVLRSHLGRIDVPLAKRLMATHDGPLASICRHPTAGSDSATISTNIFVPAQRRMLFSHGLPCQVRYDDYVLQP